MRRELSQGPGDVYTDTESWSYPTGGSPSLIGTGSYLTYVNWKETSGVDIPNFKQRLKHGELLPFTDFKQFDCYGSASGEYETITSGGRTVITPTYVTSSDWCVSEVELADLCSERDAYPLVQAAAARIYSSGHDTLTFLAELRHVVSMFRGLVPRLIDHIRSGKLENIWLEGRYGWRTLLYDIEDLDKALKSLGKKARTRAKDRVGTTERFTSVNTTVKSNASASWDWIRTDEYEVGLRGAMVADFNAATFRFNPVVTAWELTRLSFVVDWFVNVGSYLEAMSFLALTTNYAAAASYEVRCKRTGEIKNLSWNSGYSGTRTTVSSCEAVYTLRVPASVSKLPHWNLNLDWLKVGDLLALLRQALTR